MMPPEPTRPLSELNPVKARQIVAFSVRLPFVSIFDSLGFLQCFLSRGWLPLLTMSTSAKNMSVKRFETSGKRAVVSSHESCFCWKSCGHFINRELYMIKLPFLYVSRGQIATWGPEIKTVWPFDKRKRQLGQKLKPGSNWTLNDLLKGWLPVTCHHYFNKITWLCP